MRAGIICSVSPTRATIEPPPVREPRPVGDMRHILGRRLILGVYDPDVELMQHARDYRAASDVFTGELDGRDYVAVVTEADWYAWQAADPAVRPERCPHGKAWPAYLLWLD